MKAMQFRRLHFFAWLSLGIVFIAAQSFQCVSSEMTTAKLAMKQKEWKKAEQNLLKELQKRPANGEAWYLLARVRYETGNIEGMLEAIQEARKRVTNPRQRRDLEILLYRSWVEQFNKAAQLFNQGSDQQDTTILRQSLEALQRAIALKPENPENYELMGFIKQTMGDTLGTIRAFEEYLNRWAKEREFLRQHQLFLDAPLDKIHQTLGTPVAVDTSLGNQQRRVETYVQNGDTIYIFLKKEPVGSDTTWILKGLRVAPPAHWLPQEKHRFTVFSLTPFFFLIDYYNRHKQLQKALQYVDEALSVWGPQETLMRLRVGILQQMDKQEEALDALKQLIAKHPENKTYRVVYGSTLLQLGKRQEAIQQFEKALELDPQFDVALFNLGAVYKNMASEIQQEEKSLVDAGKKRSEDTSRYFPLLRQSAAYFERYRQLPGKHTNFVVLRELINIYRVLQQEQRYKELVAELKALEPLNKDNPDYYELLGQILLRENKVAEAQTAFKKADQLRGKQ